ncbi:DUF7139 domain-containing protein [Halorientalis pallida]|uniref:Uncharacterized protein n=1 Tax=Halorientalis pallida TaxID=2479928 RepID=A0A498KUB0_9EURY|nr:hypothetical protein [Halorientalis pallida]RXK48460.1 hypothetical protein EAF64_12325 [Halorientalis pallida]
MANLTDVYDGGVGGVVGRRRRFLGLSLFGLGAVMVVAAIVVATTGLADQLGLTTFGARELAGVLAGLGLPAAFLGSFAVLPASRRARAAALIGASLSVFGVVLFREAYPYEWVGSGSGPGLTLPVVVVYFLGTITLFWCLFVAVANFKTRTDPGGTVRMEVTDEGTTRILEVSGSVPGLGGIGLFGQNPDGEVQTQTNREDEDDVLYARGETHTPTGGQTAASDGGAATQQGGMADAEPVPDEVVEAASTRGQPDAYCGNCEHFQYVRVDGEIRPACTLHTEVMNDMEACDDWQANN